MNTRAKAEKHRGGILKFHNSLAETIMDDPDVQRILSEAEKQLGQKIVWDNDKSSIDGQRLQVELPQSGCYKDFFIGIINKKKAVSPSMHYFGCEPHQHGSFGKMSIPIVDRWGDRKGIFYETVQGKFQKRIEELRELFREVLCPYVAICPDICTVFDYPDLYPKGGAFRLDRCKRIKNRYVLSKGGGIIELRECFE